MRVRRSLGVRPAAACGIAAEIFCKAPNGGSRYETYPQAYGAGNGGAAGLHPDCLLPPKAWAQDTVVKLVKAMGLVEESEDDDTDTTTKAAAGGSVEFPEGMDTSAARVVTYPQDNTLYVSFNSIANRSTEYFVAGGDSMTVTGCATTEASSEKYMYFKIAFWELSDDKTSTSYVQGSTIYYCADGSAYQYNVTGLTPGKQYKITISYDNGNKYYVTGGLKVEGLGSEELNTYGEESTNS